jgi:opacity protein-like surface antigen
MKKILVFFLLFSLVNINAQFFSGLDVSLGTAKISSINSSAQSNRMSYSVGVHVGYEMAKHIPITIGFQYLYQNAEIKSPVIMANGIKSFRIPFTVGYCHYFGKIRPFVNAGVFVSLLGKTIEDIDFIDSNGQFIEHWDGGKINTYFGYIGQIGCGYKISDKLLLSVSFEYNRPFKDKAQADTSEFSGGDKIPYNTLSYTCANLSASWYF